MPWPSTSSAARDRVELMDLPDPKVGPDSVLIAVRAAGLNPVDYKAREGKHRTASRTTSR